MNTISTMSSTTNSIQQGFDSLRKNAHEIANINGNTTQNIEKPMISLIQDRHQVAASAEVIKASDETIGTLLDVIA